jgi:hypothetical protein
MLGFFASALSGSASFMDLDFDVMKRSIIVVISISVCSVNVLSCGLVVVGIAWRRHLWLRPWLVVGEKEVPQWHIHQLWKRCCHL